MSFTLLDSFIGGSKYGGDNQLYRTNDYVNSTHEPVGSLLFEPDNMQRLLNIVQSEHKTADMDDLQREMMDVFYKHCSSYAKYVDPDDKMAVKMALGDANRKVISLMNKRLGSTSNIHTQYKQLLESPNTVGSYPIHANIMDRSIQNPYYRKNDNDTNVIPVTEDLLIGLNYSLIDML